MKALAKAGQLNQAELVKKRDELALTAAKLRESLEDLGEIRLATAMLIEDLGLLRQELAKQKAITLRLIRPNNATSHVAFLKQVELEYEALQVLIRTLDLLKQEDEEHVEPSVRPEGKPAISDAARSMVFALPEGDSAS